MELRDYQRNSVNKALDYINSKEKRPGIIAAPTAAGKSLVISSIANEAQAPVLTLQPSKELLVQNMHKLELLGGKATAYSASVGEKIISDLTYATLGSIKKLAKEFKDRGVEIVAIDEAHAKYPPEKGSMFRDFMDKLQPKKVIGLTATPFRLKSMGTMHDSYSQLVMLNRSRPKYFKHFIDVIQIQEMIERGYWSKLTYNLYEFDESGLVLNSTGAEFTESSIQKALQAQGVNNNVYLRIKQLQKDKNNKILAFVDSVETARIMAERIPNAAYLTGETPKKERTRIVNEFKAGKIQVLLNYGVLTVGFDYPELNCVIMARPTNSLAVWYQIVGRGVRIHENKEYCLVEDFCGNVNRFGHVEDLTIEDHPGYGWGVFNGDRLLTGVRMDGLPVTKQKLTQKSDCSVLWYGKKYKGTKLDEIPVWYLKGQLEWISSLQKPSSRLIKLRKEIIKLLN